MIPGSFHKDALAYQAPAPLVRELPADLETPASAYLKLAGKGPSFLLESVTGGEHLARYSFIGVDLARAYVLRGSQLEIHTTDGISTHPIPAGQDPLDGLRSVLVSYAAPVLPGLPRFTGGAVGYLGYETVRFIEPTVLLKPSSDLPESIFLQADTLVAFAAKAGMTAADGSGDHSPFTAALLDSLAIPGLDLRIAFGRVRDEVMRS